MKISVVVTNWNGLELLRKNFAQVLKTCHDVHEIIFADDCSTDDSVKYIRGFQKKFPKLIITSQPQNIGFGQNTNIAVNQAAGDLVILLNNDIFPEHNFYQPALVHFKKSQTYGVGFSEIGHENFSHLFWKDGYIQYQPGHALKTHISGWVSGGGSIIRRDLFIKLGGFDPVYAPFYSEDLDLGYRAWKSGYRCLWEPKCQIHHRHESTMSRFPRRHLDYVKERNRLLTVWRNITHHPYLVENKFTQVLRVMTGPNYLKIIMAARRQIKNFPPPVVFPQLTDPEIFLQFSHD